MEPPAFLSVGLSGKFPEKLPEPKGSVRKVRERYKNCLKVPVVWYRYRYRPWKKLRLALLFIVFAEFNSLRLDPVFIGALLRVLSFLVHSEVPRVLIARLILTFELI